MTYRLPTIRHISLRNVSLYDASSEHSLDLVPGVSCFAGANGMGKSTLLALVNFGLTGIVVPPGAEFESTQEFFEDNRLYSQRYFDGRVSEEERDIATVVLEISLESRSMKIERPLFEPHSLRFLSIDGTPGQGESDSDRCKTYEAEICRYSGFADFSQFTFWQWLVVTFDEARRLILWDSKVLEQALYVGFGIDPDVARRAGDLRRDMERADSRARNAQWHATRTRRRLTELRRALAPQAAPDGTQDILAEYEVLTDRVERLQESLTISDDAIRDAQASLAAAVSLSTEARSSYDAFFERFLEGTSHVSTHPVVRGSLHEGQCQICGNSSAPALERIGLISAARSCPLCEQELGVTMNVDPEDGGRIEEDWRRAEAVVRDAHDRLDRLQAENAELRATYEAAASDLREFEGRHELTIVKSRSQPDASLFGSYEEQVDRYLAEKHQHRGERDAAKQELEDIQRVLQERWSEVEEVFVPRFRDLAADFLGLHVDVDLNINRDTSVELVLSIEGTRRRTFDQLSESQRFFVDIALRMALVHHATGPEPGLLFLDTPEGSLDIAYEAQAGTMIGNYVTAGNDLLMTANINTSELLKSLAAEVGGGRMKLIRMTEWGSLSEVQVRQQPLFDSAFAGIESLLNDAGERG